MIAIGHSILKSVYHVLSRELKYKELGAEYLLTKQLTKRKAYLLNELKKLETQVILQNTQPPQPAKTTKKKKGRCLLAQATET